MHIRQIFQALDKEYWKLLLEYIRDWNAKPKSCHVAQRVLYEFFSVVPASKIVEVRGLFLCTLLISNLHVELILSNLHLFSCRLPMTFCFTLKYLTLYFRGDLCDLIKFIAPG